MRRRKLSGNSLMGGAILFATVSVVVTVAVSLHENLVKHIENQAVITLIMLAAILLLAGICTVIDYFRRKIMVETPTKRILDATDRIASGDFSVRLEITHACHHYDEYDYIMENLNRMAAELSHTEMLHTDFISNVSHELKTPLAIIQNYATLMQDERLSPDLRRQYAETLVATSRRLTALVSNILKLNKLENQEIKLDRERIRLDDMLANTVLQYEELIDRKGLDLICDLDEVEIVSSPDYLEIVWNNLISNAIKFTPAGGTIRFSVEKLGPEAEISLKAEDGRAVVRVWDTGCGISRETGQRIFEKFYQGDTSHAGEGNGLGLALVRKVIDTIGGEISVESELGKGSTFTVILMLNQQ